MNIYTTIRLSGGTQRTEPFKRGQREDSDKVPALHQTSHLSRGSERGAEGGRYTGGEVMKEETEAQEVMEEARRRKKRKKGGMKREEKEQARMCDRRREM